MAKLLGDCFVHPLTRNEKMLMKTMIWCLVCIARVTTQYTQRPDPPGLRSKPAAEGGRWPGSLQRMVRKHEGRHGAHARSTLSALMNKHHNTVSSGVACATQTQVQPQLKPLLKVALGVHLAFCVFRVEEQQPDASVSESQRFSADRRRVCHSRACRHESQAAD